MSFLSRTCVTLALYVGLHYSADADTLISGFSPDENPMQNIGFGLLTQNPDGTQSILRRPGEQHWFIQTSILGLDLADGGKNGGFDIRLRRESDHTAEGTFNLVVEFETADAGWAAWIDIPYQFLPVGEFISFFRPFSMFSSSLPEKGPLSENLHNAVRIGFSAADGTGGITNISISHLTFDSISAAPIPEPHTNGLLAIAGAVLAARHLLRPGGRQSKIRG